MVARRIVLIAAGSGALAASFPTFAQKQPEKKKTWRIGVLFALLSPQSVEAQAFRRGLQNLGYIEGSDAIIDWRSADGDNAKLPELAADLVRRNADVIVVDTTLPAQLLKRASSTIPIVMTIVADPEGSKLIESLARPGGNVTGLSIMLAELSAKRLELLKEATPKVARVAILWNSETPYHAKAIDRLNPAASTLGIQLNFMDVRSADQLDRAFAAFDRANAQALYVLDNPLFYNNRIAILKLAASARLPVVSGEKPYAEAGALLTYGANYADQLRRAATYVDKIFKGAAPGALPVEQPTVFELIINGKTAKTLGLRIPDSLLVRAERVIQ